MPTSIAIVQKFFPRVSKVVNGKEPLRIEVTKQDDQQSKKRNHRECALAVACKRKFHADGVIISRARAYLIHGTTATRYSLPDSISREVVSFDRGASFAPGEYQLSKPPKDYDKGGNTGPTGKGYKPKHHVLSPRHTTTNIRTVLAGRDPGE